MKILLLVLLLLPYGAFAQNLKALDQKNGFRDLVFGADSTALVGREKLPTKNPSASIYNRPTDELRIGGAELQSINYFFYRGKFSDVYIKTKGLTNSRALLSALEATFGKGYQSNRFIKDFDWFGRIVTMNYEENSITGDASVFISNKAINKQQRDEEAAAAKNAKSDL
jgi:hypothetical protein